MKTIVAFSGGKDSLAALLWIRNNFTKNFTTVFSDIGWENEITYQYINITMSQLKDVTIELTAFSKPIREQLKKQGISFAPEEIKERQKDAEAISRLYMSGMLPVGETDLLRRKLANRIISKL